MKIHEGIDHLPNIKNAVVTSGTFDGVHIGHQKILQRMSDLSKEIGGESVVITFWPHPRYILSESSEELKLLSTFEERVKLLELNLVDHLITIPFTKEFSQISSEEFIQTILINGIGAKILVIGYDHRFGKNREGSFQYLKENEKKFGFQIEEIPEQDVHDIAVSSTKIRSAILAGKLDIAEEFLGRAYSIRGLVVSGDRIGRTLGYPTANLFIEEVYKLIPADGIYAVTITVKKETHKGILYIGNRPTLNAGKKAVEAFIFDFNQDIYGETIEINFIKFIRGDATFDSLEQLKDQMAKDVKDAKKILNYD